MDFEGRTAVAFLWVLDRRSFVVACRFCDGDGRAPVWMDRTGKVVSWSGRKTCPLCHGTGQLRLQSEDVPVDDRTCDGTGRVKETAFNGRYSVAAKPCRRCRGLGFRSLTGEITVLP
jgi:DnaJ-class molecular chaperone